MNLRAGHVDRVEALLKEIGSRPVSGSATESVDDAKDALWMLHNHPEASTLCGPTALKNLLVSLGSTQEQVAFLDKYHAGRKGVSLSEMAQLANQAKLDYDVVFRQSEQPVPVPSIVHWKFGHYSAVVGEANGKFHIQDPAFQRDMWVTRDAINAEASGYFLAAKRVETAAWRPVDLAEAESGAWHVGIPLTILRLIAIRLHASGHRGHRAVHCLRHLMSQSVSLLLQDTPVGYAPPNRAAREGHHQLQPA